MRKEWAPCALAALLLVGTAHAKGQTAQTSANRRFAVIVGANAAAGGRRELRYAYGDARSMAQVLIETGGFAASDVSLLLDPKPSDVIGALDEALGALKNVPDGLLLFYYSGHADPDALYPSGLRLTLRDIQRRLADKRATVRIGLIDACRGGGWTGSKGLATAPVFEVAPAIPDEAHSEGLVLIASSSGLENAHESEALQGSFFTHHWTAALRGAGDLNEDRQITVNEAFEYARGLTVRDTALAVELPQHPSFRMDLVGRGDLILSSMERPRARLRVSQTHGPLQIVQLSSGLVIAETASGPRQVALAVPTGRYLVRRRTDEGVWAAEVAVDAKEEQTVVEAKLDRVRWDVPVRKSGPRALEAAVLPQKTWEVQLGAGVRHAQVIDPGLRVSPPDGGTATLLRLAVGLGRRVQLALPGALAYGGGDEAFAWVPWVGVPVLAFGRADPAGAILSGIAGAGVDVRWRLGADTAVNTSGAALGAFQWAENDLGRCELTSAPCAPARATRRPPNTWTAQATLGLSHGIDGVVSFSLGAGVQRGVLLDGASTPWSLTAPQSGFMVSFGSVQRRGLRPLPLVRVHFSDTFTLDGHVVVAYVPARHDIVETYLAGATWLF